MLQPGSISTRVEITQMLPAACALPYEATLHSLLQGVKRGKYNIYACMTINQEVSIFRINNFHLVPVFRKFHFSKPCNVELTISMEPDTHAMVT